MKYPPKQEWDGDLRHLIFKMEDEAPSDWIDDWKVSVGLKRDKGECCVQYEEKDEDKAEVVKTRRRRASHADDGS